MKSIQTIFLPITIVSLFGYWQTNNSIEQNRRTSTILSKYDVTFTHTGYIPLHGTLEDCAIRPGGKVILKGILSGSESVEPGDPVFYDGILDLDIDMDICSSKRLANGEDKLCGMTVRGNGRVRTELEIDPDGRGAYIKFSYDSTLGRFQKSVGGTCDQPQQAEEEHMTPNKTIASIFNGRDLPMLTHRTLRNGTYVETEGDHKTEVVIRKIQ